VSVSIQVLHLSIVCPLMRHIECSLDRTTVRVESTSEKIFVELFVEVIDGVIEGKKNKLGDLVSGITTGNILSTTVAVRYLTVGGVAVLRLSLDQRESEQETCW